MFQRIPKTLFWSHFGPLWHKLGEKWIFLKKRTLSVFKYFNYLPSCQKSEKTNEPFLKNAELTDGQTTLILQDPPKDRGPIMVYLWRKQSGLMAMTGTCSEISFSATTNRSSGSFLYLYFQLIDNKVLFNRKIYFPEKYHWYRLF